MILDKINIPLDKQRIIFGAKQLVDDQKVTDYGNCWLMLLVKESGLTVHLIARIGAQDSNAQSSNNAQNNNNAQNSNTAQSNPQQNQSQPRPNNLPNQSSFPQPNLSNPFDLLRGMGLGVSMPQPTGVTINTDLGSSIGSLLGSFGIRIPPQVPQQRPSENPHNNPFQTPPTNTQRQHQQPQQPTSTFNLTQSQNLQQVPSNQPQQNTQFQVSNEPILRLNETITTLNLPAEPVLSNQQLSLREQTAQYLRRLQHQYMRMIPQLNRTVQLLNEGRISHLNEILRLFEAIDGANHHAQ